jgi:hypothetical protein
VAGELGGLDVIVDGAQLLAEMHSAFRYYVVFPSPEAADAVVLWVATTHAQTAWQHATRLHLTSPVKRCGKSRLLDIIHATSYRPVITVNISPAALVRLIGDDPPTLLIDEIDTVFGKKASENHEDLRGILNAGHQRNRPYLRCVGVGASQHVESFPSFAMAALAGIGGLPDTIEDRSVIIRLRRRAPGEKVAPFRLKKDVPASMRSASGSARRCAATPASWPTRSHRCPSRTVPPTAGNHWSRSPTWRAVTGRHGRARPRTSSRLRLSVPTRGHLWGCDCSPT